MYAYFGKRHYSTIMKANLKDRFLLIVTGLGIFIVGIPIYLLLDTRLSEEWSSFIFMSLGYFVALIYLPFTSRRLRKLSKIKIIRCIHH